MVQPIVSVDVVTSGRMRWTSGEILSAMNVPARLWGSCISTTATYRW